MKLTTFLLMLKGGPGSGNKGHSGRIGKRGGSTSKDSGTVTHEDLSNLYNQYTPEQIDSIKRYTWGAYNSINSHFRFGTEIGEFEKKVIKDLDSTIDSSPRTPKDIITYRQIRPDIFNNLIKKGSVFQDIAFVSTTLRKELTDGDGQLTIKVPKGSKAAYLGEFSGNTYENELLLPRNSKFKVVEKVGNTAVLELVE